jgi:hypothetical protein
MSLSDMGVSSLSEYLSRCARGELSAACLEGLREQMRGEDGQVRGAPVAAFAAMVDVTPRTVERWLAKGIQSCNVNAEKIIELAMSLNPEEAKRILYGDLAMHREQLADIITEATRHGDVASGEEVTGPEGVGGGLPGDAGKIVGGG